MELSPEITQNLCAEHDLYRTPHLNDRLYLHYKVGMHSLYYMCVYDDGMVMIRDPFIPALIEKD